MHSKIRAVFLTGVIIATKGLITQEIVDLGEGGGGKDHDSSFESSLGMSDFTRVNRYFY